MYKSIAILSGKGGSGKTTLALSLSKLFSSIEKKVLLIDCDFSTHGASYFYDEYLENDKNTDIFDFYELLFSHVDITHTTKKIFRNENNISESNIGFVPSHKSFKTFDIQEWKNIDKTKLYADLKTVIADGVYDVVIFDCQAGFSMATEMAVGFVDKKLIVTEADRISTASMRSLYRKLPEQLSEDTYQIFNKVTEEEYHNYNRVVEGTLFTNLTPIRFEWDIRNAFLNKDLPAVDDSTSALTSAICTLAISLFPRYKDKLRKKLIYVKEMVLDETEEKIGTNNGFKNKGFLQILYPSLFAISFVSVTWLIFLISGMEMHSVVQYFFLVVIIALMVLSISIAYRTFRVEDPKMKIEQTLLKMTKDELRRDISELHRHIKNMASAEDSGI